MPITNSFHDSFNAKFMSYEEIAAVFVVNDDFEKICSNTHSVIMGPRGCGKTTMFKMLSSSAQKIWKPIDQHDIDIKSKINFISIYISSDELWKKQLESINDLIENEKNSAIIKKSIITTNILSNFCLSMHEYLYNSINNSQEKEADFAFALINKFKLEKCALNILSVRIALENRKANILLEIENSYYNSKIIKLEDYYFLDFLEILKISFMEYERIYNNGKQLKWALCFDELELVSNEFYDELLKKLRISPHNILFKLSVGPLADFSNTTAQLDNDYTVIKMWPWNTLKDNQYREFIYKIAEKRICNYLNVNHITLELLFFKLEKNYKSFALKSYKSKIPDGAEEIHQTKSGSLTDIVFKELAEKDENFKNFLIKNSVDPIKPLPLKDIEKYNTFIRKLKEIVINRLVFIDFKKGKLPVKTNKSGRLKIFPIYYGIDTICSLCEGNPRLIYLIINEFIKVLTPTIISNKDFTRTKEPIIHYKLQCKIVQNFSSRFQSMIKNYPFNLSSSVNSNKYSVIKTIETLGKYFEKQFNQGEYLINPVTCFTINPQKTKKEYLEIIKIALELGAIIKLDPDENYLDSSYKNSVFRLSYILHPEFKLPFRKYNSVDFNYIFKNSSIGTSTDLFNLNDNEN